MTDNSIRNTDVNPMTDNNAPATTGELLPCPKCAGEARVCISSDGDVEWVQCQNCLHEGPTHYKREKAIAAWNARTTDAPVPAGEPHDYARCLYPLGDCSHAAALAAKDKRIAELEAQVKAQVDLLEQYGHMDFTSINTALDKGEGK